MARYRVTVTKKAAEILSVLTTTTKKSPEELVEAMIIDRHAIAEDDNLVQKVMPASCMVYEVDLPFAFPYELERFDVTYSNLNIIAYLERFPKRYASEGTGFFKTKGYVIIPFSNNEIADLRKNDPLIFGNTKGSNEYLKIAYHVITKLIISYRRAENTYYNLGVIEPPLNIEVFSRNARMTIRIDGLPIRTITFQSVSYPSKIVVTWKMEEGTRNQIVNALFASTEPDKDFLFNSQQFREAGIGFFYHEQWNLCLLQSVIAMETGLASLILRTETSKLIMKIHSLTSDEIKEKYREAQGLPNKNNKFLFPLLSHLEAHDILDELREITPHVYNKKTNEGVYELRSKIVHEGVSVDKNQAEASITLAERYLNILQAVAIRASPKSK